MVWKKEGLRSSLAGERWVFMCLVEGHNHVREL